MSQVDKQALRSVAENATPGEWCKDECHGVIADAGLNANYYIASCSGPEHQANARYIAAANPATMLALLDENEALAAENDRLKQSANEMQAHGVERCATWIQGGCKYSRMAEMLREFARNMREGKA